MAFTLEDGTGVSGANAYISDTYFTTYHTDRGVDATYTATEIQQHIIRASDYVDKRFGRRFRGFKLRSDQGREWPRLDAYSDDDHTLSGVPDKLEFAIAEYSLLSLQLDRNLAPMPTPDFGVQDPETGDVTQTGGGKIIEKSEEVGPLKESTKYAAGNTTGKPMAGTGNMILNIPEYPQADLWIEELTDPYGNRSLTRG